jgi:hypothetical protein
MAERWGRSVETLAWMAGLKQWWRLAACSTWAEADDPVNRGRRMMWVGGDFGRDRSGAGREQRLSACRRSGGRRLWAVGGGMAGSGGAPNGSGDSAADRDANSGSGFE